MRIRTLKYLLIFVSLLGLGSCGINSNVMFKAPKGEEVKYDSIPDRPLEEYKLTRDDKFTMFVSTSKGQNIINQMSGINDANGLATPSNPIQMEYLIDVRGNTTLPIIGELHVEGLTVKLLEDTLSRLYDDLAGYNRPLVKVNLTNQRVIVFPGEGGDAKVIPLLNNNTTLMEALASAGGLANRGKANSIKVIREEAGKRKIYKIDLSTEEGINRADMIVQANDYIYVEPHERYGREILNQIAPFVSVLASLVVMISIISK